MKIHRAAAIALALLVLFGCQKKSKKNYLWGYLNPGTFRPYGIAPEKTYNFSFSDIVVNAYITEINWKSCNWPPAWLPGSDNPCQAVYTNWFNIQAVTKIPYEGIAVNDNNKLYTGSLDKPIFSFKIACVPGTLCDISANVKGINYTATGVPASAVTFAISDSSMDTQPACPTPTCEADYLTSGVKLRLCTVKFNQDITLTASPPAATGMNPTIKILTTDSIVAQDYSAF